MKAMQRPIILLQEGTEAQQGRTHVMSNINACQAISDAVRTTLGPRGMDKLMVDGKGWSGFLLFGSHEYSSRTLLSMVTIKIIPTSGFWQSQCSYNGGDIRAGSMTATLCIFLWAALIR